MRTRRSMLTFSCGVLFTVVVTLLGFVATPYIVHWLGDEAYGAVRTLGEWAAYLTLLDLGLGAASLAMLAKALAVGPHSTADATRAALRAFRVVAGLTLLGGLILTIATPWIVRVSTPELRDDVQLAMAIGCAATALTVFSNPFRALFESAQRGYVVMLLLLGQSLVFIGLSVLLAWQKWGVTGQSVAMAASTVLFAATITIAGWRWFLRHRGERAGGRDVLPASANATMTESAGAESAALDVHIGGGWSRLLWRTNGPAFIVDVVGRISVLSDAIVISLCIGTAAVTPFFLTQRLIAAAVTQLNGIGGATWAAMASLHHRAAHEGDAESRALLHRRLIELSRLVVIIGGAVLVPIAAYNRDFIHLWIGPRVWGGEALTILAAGVGLTMAVLSLWGWALRGAGVIAPIVPVSIAAAIVNVSLSVGLTWWLGWIEGPLIGTACAILFVWSWNYPRLMKKHLGLSVSALFGGLALPLAVTIACGFAAYWLAMTFPAQSWIRLLGSMFIISVAFMTIGWFFLFRNEERALWRHRLQLMLGRGSEAA